MMQRHRLDLGMQTFEQVTDEFYLAMGPKYFVFKCRSRSGGILEAAKAIVMCLSITDERLDSWSCVICDCNPQ